MADASPPCPAPPAHLDPPGSRSASHGLNLVWLAAVAISYFAAARASLAFVFQPEGIAALWPPSGIFLSALLLTRPALRPHLAVLLFFTDLLAELLTGTPFPVSVVYAASLTGDALVSAWLLRHFLGERIDFSRVKDVFGLLGLAIVLSNAVWSLAPAAAAARLLPGVSFWTSWGWWATSAGIGNLLVTPLVLSWAPLLRRGIGSLDRARGLEAAALFVSFAGLNLLEFGPASEHGQFSLLLDYLTLPLLLWAGLRFGVRGVTLALALLAAIAVPSAAAGYAATGVFQHSQATAVINVQLYLALIAIPALVLAAVVTERARAHADLRESAASLASAQRIAHLGSWTLEISEPGDLARASMWWSDETFRIFGFEPGAVSVSHRLFSQAIHPEDRLRLLTEMERAAQERTSCELQHRILRPDGSERMVREHAEVALDRRGGGRPVRLLGTVQDVTEQVRLETDLRQSQKMEAIGRLAGGVAHDFNNLLMIIESSASLLRDGRELSERDAMATAYIFEAAERAGTLTRQLLLFSRKQQMELSDVDLGEVVGQMAKMLRRILGEDIALDYHCDPDLPPVHADPGMLEQVLLNLAVNARDAMPRGGRLSIAASAEQVGARAVRETSEAEAGLHVRLEVADTGSGIAPENLSRIFEPFFTTKDTGKGTGLGLATVYGIVKQHRGWIEVASELDRGTVFLIYFPASAEGRSSPVAAPPGLASQRGQEVLLFVEDEPSVRRLVRHHLQGYGYTVLEAASGVAALEVWRAHKENVALLLTDMVMPDGMTGRDLAERLLADKPALKVIYTSGYAVEELDSEAPLVEGTNFLQKPYHPDRLAEAVRRRLDQS